MRYIVSCTFLLFSLLSGLGADSNDYGKLMEKAATSKGFRVTAPGCNLSVWVDAGAVKADGHLALLVLNENDYDLFVRSETFWYLNEHSGSRMMDATVPNGPYSLAQQGKGTRAYALVRAHPITKGDQNRISNEWDVVAALEVISRKDGKQHKLRVRIDGRTLEPIPEPTEKFP